MKITLPPITQGEWRVGPDGVEPLKAKWSTPYIAAIDERTANAQAIAALPDLIAALADTLQRIEDSEHWWIDSPDSGGMDAERIRAALLKAGATITE